MIQKKIKSTAIATSILVFTMIGTSFAYSKDFKGTFITGDTVNGSSSNIYYPLEAKKTTIKGTAKVTNTSLGATEKAYIEVRRVTSSGSAQAHYYTSSSYKTSTSISTSFTAKKGSHYLILRKAQRNVPGEISGTISQ